MRTVSPTTRPLRGPGEKPLGYDGLHSGRAPSPRTGAEEGSCGPGRSPARMAAPAAKWSGEISHLTRSCEYAVRTGAFADAVSIFSGLLTEGKERVMAGDILFRVAAEDMVDGGEKLVYAVKAWQLASALGWRGGDVVMGAAVA